MHELTRKGYSAEHFVVYDLIECEYIPCMPTIPSSEFDILAVRGDIKIKIQVKSSEFKGNRLKVDLRKSNGRDGRAYKDTDVDVYAIFDRKNKEVAYLPASKLIGRSQVTLYKEYPENLNGFTTKSVDSITLFSGVTDINNTTKELKPKQDAS